jgi:hypothetical protein
MWRSYFLLLFVKVTTDTLPKRSKIDEDKVTLLENYYYNKTKSYSD